MRIAVVHSFYRSSQPSGENLVVAQQSQLLREAGYEVRVYARNSDDYASSRSYPLRAATTTITGFGPSPLREINRFHPDIVHIHNLFPNYGTHWLARVNAPIVTTLHNFRSVCANGLLFRDGQVCMDCPSGKPLSALIHRCYRHSRASTAPLAFRNRHGVKHDALISRSQALVCLNQSAAQLFTDFGADQEKIRVIPNGINVDAVSGSSSVNARWIFAGRLESAKGIANLLKIWPIQESLDIFGTGPLLDELKADAEANVNVMGPKPQATILEILAGYSGLILPSLSLEMQPTVAVEALSVGTPVVARIGNATANLVEARECGATYSDGASLRQALSAVKSNRSRLSAQARATFESEFSADVWLERITSLYRELVAN